MESLILKSERKIRLVSTEIKRYIFERINLQNRLTIIKGARGVGKTTLLLQYAKEVRSADKKVLYVALDDLFFQGNRLYELAEEFVLNNGYLLLLDEIHKYPGWSRELKLIYDDFPQLKLIVTSSSLLEIYRSGADLSRRAISLTLKELSFREFLVFKRGLFFDKVDVDDLMDNHLELSYEITSKIKPVFEFKEYVASGMYPFYWENPDSFYDKLFQVINLVLEVDLPAIESLDYNHIVKIKKLLFAIATSEPFTPNITKLSERVGMSRPALIKALHYLERARLIILLNKPNKGLSALSKPDKVFLNNPNIHYAIDSKNPLIGTVRESFFVNQLSGLYDVHLAGKGDFIINNKYTLEIGGKNKTGKQTKGIKNAHIVKDNIENGTEGVIPLWMFGFLY